MTRLSATPCEMRTPMAPNLRLRTRMLARSGTRPKGVACRACWRSTCKYASVRYHTVKHLQRPSSGILAVRSRSSVFSYTIVLWRGAHATYRRPAAAHPRRHAVRPSCADHGILQALNVRSRAYPQPPQVDNGVHHNLGSREGATQHPVLVSIPLKTRRAKCGCLNSPSINCLAFLLTYLQFVQVQVQGSSVPGPSMKGLKGRKEGVQSRYRWLRVQGKAIEKASALKWSCLEWLACSPVQGLSKSAC